MPDIKVENIGFAYGENRVVDGISFHVHEGEFFTLLGPSGCGKSTTLSAIAGFNDPSEGRILLGDRVLVDAKKKYYVPPESRDIGMVFQSYALWPHMTVQENVAMPLKIKKIPTSRHKSMIEKILEQVGLGSHQKRYPHELSGGQQQRVALARAMVYEPDMLILDEPLSNLDAKLREHARTWLKELQRDTGITTVYVTHDQQEAMYLSDRIAVLDAGRLAQVGTPEEVYDSPATPNAADFVGRCNFFDGEVASDGSIKLSNVEANLSNTNAEVSVGQKTRVGIRPERLHIISSETESLVDTLPAKLISSAYVGIGYDHVFQVGSQQISVVQSERFEEPVARLALNKKAYVFQA